MLFYVVLVSDFTHSLQVIRSLQPSSHSSADSSELHDPKRVMEVSLGKNILTCNSGVPDLVNTYKIHVSRKILLGGPNVG
jgi:hypothetical protein